MDKGLWVVDGTVTHTTSFRLATQAEIDAAASEQLRQDAEVGRALENVPDLFQLWQEDDLWYVEYLDRPKHKMVEFVGDTPHAALAAAGLMEEGK